MRVAASKIPAPAAAGTIRNSKTSPLSVLNKLKNGGGIQDSTVPDSPPTTSQTTPSAPKASQADLQAKLDEMKKTLRFDQVAGFLQGEGKALQDAPALTESFLNLVKMKQWVDSEMDAATLSNPVNVNIIIDGAQVPVSVYRGGAIGSYTVLNTTSGQTSEVPFENFGAAGAQSLVQGLISHPIRQADPNASVWLAEFQRQYPNP
jgi:hypothetical protein